MNNCGKQNCDPILQTRGEMTKEDYFDVLENDKMHAANERLPEDATVEDIADITPENKNDIRIICGLCMKTTGWCKGDVPGMPGAGKLWCEKKWDELV